MPPILDSRHVALALCFTPCRPQYEMPGSHTAVCALCLTGRDRGFVALARKFLDSAEEDDTALTAASPSSPPRTQRSQSQASTAYSYMENAFRTIHALGSTPLLLMPFFGNALVLSSHEPAGGLHGGGEPATLTVGDLMERTSNLTSNLLTSSALTDGMKAGGVHGVTSCSCLVSHFGGKLQILDPMVSTSELNSTNGKLATVWCGTRVGEGGDTAGGEVLQYLPKEGTWTRLSDVVISRGHVLVSGEALPGVCVVGYVPPAHMSRSSGRRSPPHPNGAPLPSEPPDGAPPWSSSSTEGPSSRLGVLEALQELSSAYPKVHTLCACDEGMYMLHRADAATAVQLPNLDTPPYFGIFMDGEVIGSLMDAQDDASIKGSLLQVLAGWEEAKQSAA